MDIYVKWPQLEDAITGNQSNSFEKNRPNSGRPSSSGSYSAEYHKQTSPRPPSNNSEKTSRPDSSSSSSGRSHRLHKNSRSSNMSDNEKGQRELYQPSENVIKRLQDLGLLGERHNALMDALERARVRTHLFSFSRF